MVAEHNVVNLSPLDEQNTTMEETSTSSEEVYFGNLTEDDEEICIEDLPKGEDDEISPLDVDESNQAELEDNEVEGGEGTKVLLETSCDAKLRELLRNLCSIEVKIYSEASNEFVSVLKGDLGGKMLHQYVQASPSCMELMEAWKLRQGKPGMAYVLSLISAILNHPNGKYCMDDLGRLTISRRLDKFARSIIETKLEDIYMELNSKESKRQSAALLLMATIVRRGVGLASEVAKIFDFKLPVFPKLAEFREKKMGKKIKYSTRLSFIEFAMSFLESGNPRLLRWILQQKDMYFGVLRGLGCDDDGTIVYVLSTLRDKILNPDSLVPPGLRSVLFGGVTLEQLSDISGNPIGGPAAETAHEVLVMVCTDPCHGLMPDLKSHGNPLRGNPKRLLGLMKKLRATEIGYHRDLLLAIVKGRLSLCSSYLDEFPYILEPRASPTWFAAISLTADLISSANTHLSFTSLAPQSQYPPPLDSYEMQCVLKCIVPRSFTRLVINRGLLHSNMLVKHGSLRLLLEALKALDNLVIAIDGLLENMTVKRSTVTFDEGLPKLNGLPGISNLGTVDKGLDANGVGNSSTGKSTLQNWVFLKQEIQDEVRAMLPDCQVLLKLLLSLSQNCSKKSETSVKRARTSEYSPEIHFSNGVKKLKSDSTHENIDILISGINAELSIGAPGDHGKGKPSFIAEEVGTGDNDMMVIARIWGLCESSMIGSELKSAEIYFHSKLLDVLTFYLRTMPVGLEGSFDFFKILPSDPLILPVNLQQSLLSLLIEYIGQSPGRRVSTRCPDLMYKHLQPLINLLIFSPVKAIQDQAYVLARAAMISTGAFDRNHSEIDAWLSFLPNYSRDKFFVENREAEMFWGLSTVVLSFFCDAVSTMGNNLYKYLDHLRCLTSKLGVEDISPDFSPLVVCILQKCLSVLESDSGTFKLSERSLISIYVSNTLSYLLQTQVDVGLLSGLIDLILTEKTEHLYSGDDDSGDTPCEWRPLKNLLHFVRSIVHQNACRNFYNITGTTIIADGHSLLKMLGKVKKIIASGHDRGLVEVAIAFSSAIICAPPNDVLQNFPLLITVGHHLFGEHLSFLLSIFSHEHKFLSSVANLWPNVFFSGLEMVGATNGNDSQKDDVKSAGVAFSLILKHAPFYALFPSIIGFGNSILLGSTKILDFFRAKLSECSTDRCIASLRLLLFWVHQLHISFSANPSVELEQMLETCFILIDHVLVHFLVVITDSYSSKTIQELVEILSHHPAVIEPLLHPLCSKEKLAEEIIGDNLEDLLNLAKRSIHPTEHHLLHLLKRVADSLLALENSQRVASVVNDTVFKSVVKAFKKLARQAILVLKEKFDQCILTNDLIPLLPSFYIFHSLKSFISPFELLELVHWMFSKVNKNDLTGWTSIRVSALFVGFYISANAFDMLSSCFHQRNMETITCFLFWEPESREFDVGLLEKVYYKIIEFATCVRLECADLCLLKAVSAVHGKKLASSQAALIPLSMIMSRMVISSPIRMLDHLIHRTSKTKAKTLFYLVEVSTLHLSLFGQIFLSILNKVMPYGDDMTVDVTLFKGNCDHALSDEDFLLLLPAALSYLTSNLMKFRKQNLKVFGNIPLFYSRILLDGFSNWKTYVSRSIFEEEYNEEKQFEFTPMCLEEFLNLFRSSLLGKAIHMLRYYFILNGNSMKKKERVKIFDSIYPSSSLHHEELLDCDVSDINVCSFKPSLNLINRIVAKIYFSRMLLFPQDNSIGFLQMDVDESTKESAKVPRPLEKCYSRIFSARLRFINILVSALDNIVRKFPFNPDNTQKSVSADCCQFFRLLEIFILRNIVQISMEMRSDLIQLHNIPFLEQFTRSSLLHRFEDPHTLKALRSILISLSEGKFSCSEVFELLLAHSQLVPIILSSDSISDNSGRSHTGALFQPISSFLKLLVVPSNDQSGTDEKNIHDIELRYEHSAFYKRKLEVIKLLRVLYRLKARQCSISPGKIVSMNSRELLSLLLSGYGATLSETDLEIFHLMHEIECIEGSNCVSIAEMDYLWGNSALKLRREHTLERYLSSNNVADCEMAEDLRKRQFRENLPVDSKLCVTTVQYFCYDRVSWTGLTSLEKLQTNNVMDTPETPSTCMKSIRRYDPAFILRFSIHGLLMGYIEPIEFARLGLLAIAFVSMSSSDEGMRKLGYDTLGRFKKALENFRSSRDKLRLRLLLTYLQNGISEPWQKIPSMTAIFAAEASFILLDPSHDHYLTISKLLMRSPRVDLKCVPLFHTLFGSSSIHFKMDRLWILRLSYAGLNLDDDAQIIMRKFLLELLLSFYSSSLSDSESKTLILQIVKKSVKLHTLARYLVEHCCLISWLSSVLSLCGEKLYGDHKNFYMTQITMILEVVSDVLSFRNMTEWLQKYALEQLSELSVHLHMLFVGGMVSLNENVGLANSILHILLSTLRISQKRKMYQPHFTLSVEGLFNLYQAIDGKLSNVGSGLTAELGLKTILMSTPPTIVFHMEGAKLLKFLMWAVSTALHSFSTQTFLLKDSDLHLTNMLEEQQSEDSLVSKLLRWLTASIILGRISRVRNKIKAPFSLERLNVESLQFLLDHLEKGHGERIRNDDSVDEALAVIILYLQQLVGMECKDLPSVVSALRLLVSDATFSKDHLDANNCSNIVSLCSRIRCPTEASPAWRWSYYQPWKDLSSELTNLQEMDEYHACQSILIIFANALGGKSLGLPVLSCGDVENSGLFAWERNTFLLNET
ncbi:ribosome 60S biogenesis amino-terminal protein isoform X2 [Tasmannia lanceolata]|uniref:ribosome 60S biogenesis amino-terminal protein isoform X2 n=1 Tax=Tasmannia lanceolata TaxID=3420 RepID=UPI0040643971